MLNKVVHIYISVRYWEKNVMLSFKQIPKPTLFTGILMHIITTFRFRLISSIMIITRSTRETPITHSLIIPVLRSSFTMNRSI